MVDKDERAERLAAQLRANLRRRKTQARGVADQEGSGAHLAASHVASADDSKGDSDDATTA